MYQQLHNFYIQNTLGVKALNNILGDSIKKHGVGNKSLNDFKLTIPSYEDEIYIIFNGRRIKKELNNVEIIEKF